MHVGLMPTVIEITGTITSNSGSGSGTLASSGQAFTATITTDGLSSDLDAGASRGFFNLVNPSITLQLSGGTITTYQGSFEVTDAVSGSDGLLLAATTPFDSSGNTVNVLYFDYSYSTADQFSSDQQPLTALSAPGDTIHKWLSLTYNSWQYQGEITNTTVSAVPEPSVSAFVFGMAAVALLVWRRASRLFRS